MTIQLTEPEVRLRFARYYIELMEHGAMTLTLRTRVNEWAVFVHRLIDEGSVPPEAGQWKCPRSVQEEVRKPRPLPEVVFDELRVAGKPLSADDLAIALSTAPQIVLRALRSLHELRRIQACDEAPEDRSTQYVVATSVPPGT